MTKEALRLALEALETPWNAPYVNGCDLALGKKVKAIIAIKEALVNEALEKMAENARELGLDYGPEQDWIERERAVGYREGHRAALAQRTWVGLTEREQGAIMEDLNAYGTNLYEFAQAIEAKLRSKNESKN